MRSMLTILGVTAAVATAEQNYLDDELDLANLVKEIEETQLLPP